MVAVNCHGDRLDQRGMLFVSTSVSRCMLCRHKAGNYLSLIDQLGCCKWRVKCCFSTVNVA